MIFLQDKTLQFVHQQKVIHRDVNPGNLLRRTQDGKIGLTVKQITTQVAHSPGKQNLPLPLAPRICT